MLTKNTQGCRKKQREGCIGGCHEGKSEDLLFWFSAPCNVVEIYRRCGEISCLLPSTETHYCFESRDSISFRNVGTFYLITHCQHILIQLASMSYTHIHTYIEAYIYVHINIRPYKHTYAFLLSSYYVCMKIYAFSYQLSKCTACSLNSFHFIVFCFIFFFSRRDNKILEILWTKIN
jgi:hypothetical protein